MLDAGEVPVAEVAALARREGVRPRDAYQAHKWFARRLAATARSLLVAASTPAGGDFWDAYYRTADCTGLKVMDPFMGGGVMLLEARRLGADAHGTDVEPVAAAVSDFQGRLADLPDLSPALAGLFDAVGREIEPLYAARHGEGAGRLLHGFWVQVVDCAACGRAYDAHPSFRVAWDDAGGRQWAACRDCGEVSCCPTGTHLACRCGTVTDPMSGTVSYGKASCPSCGHTERLIDVGARTGCPPAFRLFAVETIPAGPERRFAMRDRLIRTADAEDLGRYAIAGARLAAEVSSDAAFVPPGPVPSAGRFDDRLLRYGYRDYGQLANARQAVHLGLLARALDGIAGAGGEALRIAFSDHVATNNMMCGYSGGWRKLSPLFSIRAYRHIPRPVELNPWLSLNGRGTFPNAVRSISRASRALRGWTEPGRDGPPVPVPPRPPGGWDLRCADARDLSHVPDGSVDLVLTDPPYFDYVAYSELGHFFVPWMVRLGLLDARHLEAFPPGQLASSLRADDVERIFAESLSERLRGVARACGPEARLAFTYQNLDGRGWRALAHALGASGMTPVHAFPMFGEAGSGQHKHAGSASWDCVVVCRVHGCPAVPGYGPDAAEAGAALAASWRERLAASGHRLSAGDLANIAHAGALLHALAPARDGARAAPEAVTA